MFNKHIAVLFFQKGKYTGSYKALGQIESLVTNSMDITFIKTLWAKTHSVLSHLNVFGPHFNTQLGHRIIFVNIKIPWLVWSPDKTPCDFYLSAIYLAEFRRIKTQTQNSPETPCSTRKSVFSLETIFFMFCMYI